MKKKLVWATAFFMLFCGSMVTRQIVCRYGHRLACARETEARTIVAGIHTTDDGAALERLQSLLFRSSTLISGRLPWHGDGLFDVEVDNIRLGKGNRARTVDAHDVISAQEEVYFNAAFSQVVMMAAAPDYAKLRELSGPVDIPKEMLDKAVLIVRWNTLKDYAEMAGLLDLAASSFALLAAVMLVTRYTKCLRLRKEELEHGRQV